MTSKESLPGFILRKTLQTLLSLLLLVFLIFILLHHLPGGPFDPETAANPLVRERLQHLGSLDQPLIIQLGQYLRSLLQGNLGHSLVTPEKSVGELLRQGAAQSLPLVGVTLLLVYILSLAAALLSSYRESPFVDSILDAMMVLGLAMPSLFLGPVLVYFFSFVWNLLPTAFLDHPQNYILPVATLLLRPWAQLTLLLRNSLRETLSQEYIRTAKAKGLGSAAILFQHALRNAVVPVLSLSGPLVVGVLSGTFVVEVLFSIPGLGREFVDSLNTRDYPVVTGLVLFYGIMLMTLTQVFEVLIRTLDPRLRGSE